MDNFNRIISFVLGLIVVIVFLIVISGRINLKERILSQGQAKPSSSATVKIQSSITPTPTVRFKKVLAKKTVITAPVTKIKTPASIPATGSATVLIPLVFSSLSAGLYLLKKTKS